MTRRCSHCGHNGHNSRTCPDRGVKLFGVRLTTEGLMRKSTSMGNLSHYSACGSASISASASGSPSNQAASPEQSESGAADDGYLSDGMVQTSKSRERKKGVPWTEEEHKMFLLGLQKLGKGDWRGISRNFVTSRTPTQVASHAQKYFLRQSNLNKRKRRSSLFDISADTVGDCHRRIPELSPSIHELALTPTSSLTSGNFFKAPSPNLTISVGAFALTSFAAPSRISPSLSLGISSRLDRTSNVDKIAAPHHAAKYSFLTIPEHTESGLEFSNSTPTTTYSFPLPLWPELSTSKRAKEEEKGCVENNEDSGLSLSIAPPCVELELDSPAFHSSSNAIRVV